MILPPGQKPRRMLLWFHPMLQPFPSKGDMLQIPDARGNYTSYRVVATVPPLRRVLLWRVG
jgi:hypothetical protein